MRHEIPCGLLLSLVLIGAPAAADVQLLGNANLADEGSFSGPKIEKLVFSPDGSQLVAATSRGLRIVQTDNCSIIGRIQFNAFSVAYSRDGSRAFAIGTGGRKLIDMDLGIEIKFDSARVDGSIGAVIDRRDGKLVITRILSGSPCAMNKKIRVGDELVSVGDGLSGPMRSVERTSPQRAVGSIKGVAGTHVRLGIIHQGNFTEEIHPLMRLAVRERNGRTVYLPFKAREVDDHVVWCLSDGNHEFSNARTGQVVSAFRMQNMPNTSGTPVVSRDGKRFAFVSKFLETPALVQREPPSPERKRAGDGNVARSVKRAAGDAVAAGGARAGMHGVELYDIASRELIQTFPVDIEPVNTLVPVKAFFGAQFTPDGNHLVLGTWSKVHIYDVATGEKVNEFSVPADEDSGVRPLEKMSVSNHHVAVGNLSGVVHLLDIKTGEPLQSIRTRKEEPVDGVALSDRGDRLAFVVKSVLYLVDVSKHVPAK